MSTDEYIRRARQSPRLTTLFEEFSRIAAGESGVPLHSPLRMDPDLAEQDAPTLRFCEQYLRLVGVFTTHYLASVPYALEEECRIGTTIWLASAAHARLAPDPPLKLYTLGSADGAMARTAAQISQGTVHSVSCSPNIENDREFRNRGAPESARFFHGPFFDLINAVRNRDPRFAPFHGGFDIIVEDTTFQMYGRERNEPLELVSGVLKQTGILILIEKLRHRDIEEYSRRERQKDEVFKSRFFRVADIVSKQDMILDVMYNQQVTLDALINAIRPFFPYCVMTWNSGNFYTLAASRSDTALSDFIGLMTPPNISASFCYERLPRSLLGMTAKIEFREPVRAGNNPEMNFLCRV